MSSIAIIDYGMGNIHSVKKALEACGASPFVTNDPLKIKSADKVVLPGVGAFGDAMAELSRRGLVEPIKEHVHDRKIILGICLGMHLFFGTSEENPGAEGLGVLEGSVIKFKTGMGYKVPHMGWNEIIFRKTDCPLFEGMDNGSSVYFCHSYYPDPVDRDCVSASTEYGTDFPSMIWKDNIYAMQFHPEKSQATGLSLVKNFVRL